MRERVMRVRREVERERERDVTQGTLEREREERHQSSDV
jgi:hypothetical protein